MDWVVRNASFFSDLQPKIPMVCYSTTAASMRNMTSSPWKSSMSRYSWRSLQVGQFVHCILNLNVIHCERFVCLFPRYFECIAVTHLLPCFPGETKTTVSPYVLGGVSDGQWHVVEVHYYNKVRSRTNRPDASTGVLYGLVYNYI